MIRSRRSIAYGLWRLAACGALLLSAFSPLAFAEESARRGWFERLSELMAKIGFTRPPESGMFREAPSASSDTSPGEAKDRAVWTMARDGSGATRLSSDGGYDWPVFAPDGKRVAALRDDEIVILKAHAKPIIVPFATIRDARPKILLAWTNAGISLLMSDRIVVLVHPEQGVGTEVGAVPGETDAEAVLLRSTRACGKYYTTTSAPPPDSSGRLGRSDIVLYTNHAAEGELAMPPGVLLTRDSKRTRNLEPALSADCKRIAFVAEP
jgi:hypothetical protein